MSGVKPEPRIRISVPIVPEVGVMLSITGGVVGRLSITGEVVVVGGSPNREGAQLLKPARISRSVVIETT